MPRPPETMMSASVTSGRPVAPLSVRHHGAKIGLSFSGTVIRSTVAILPAGGSSKHVGAEREDLDRGLHLHVDHRLPRINGRVAITSPFSTRRATQSDARPAFELHGNTWSKVFSHLDGGKKHHVGCLLRCDRWL